MAGAGGVIEYQSPEVARKIARRRLFEVSVNSTLIGLILAVVLVLVLDRRRHPPSPYFVNQRHAREYVAALDQFRRERGTYPAALDELVPGYLKRIPATQPGTSWQYRATSAGQAFQLQWQRIGIAYLYDSTTRQISSTTAPAATTGPTATSVPASR